MKVEKENSSIVKEIYRSLDSKLRNNAFQAVLNI